MNIRKELEKILDTRPFNDEQLCEMWKKWKSSMTTQNARKEKWV